MRWKKTIKLSIVTNNNTSKGIPITLLLSPSDNEYITMLETYIKEAAKKAGYRLNFVDSKDSSEVQIRQVESARVNGEKAVILNMVDPNDAERILEAAGDMKVVFVLRAPADMSVLNENAVLVTSDDNVAGRLQGEFLANYFNTRNRRDIRYILLEGPPDISITKQRTAMALQALADGGINATEAAPPIFANFQRSEAEYMIYPILTSGVQFDTIISNNDAMALGAIDALNALNIDPSKTPIVGVDATYSAFQALRNGEIAMTVFQNAKAQGEAAVAAVTNMLAGMPANENTGYETLPDNQYVISIPFEPVTLNTIPKDLEYPISII